jgi:hypothetical protein
MTEPRYRYDETEDAIYENEVKQEGLWKQDLQTLQNLAYDAVHSRFEYEGQEVRFDGSAWVITDPVTSAVLFRATSPAHALRWLVDVL